MSSPIYAVPDWPTRRLTDWLPWDNGRRCYGCGLPPDGAYSNGSPHYAAHAHPVSTAPPERVVAWLAMRPTVSLSEADVARVEAHTAAVAAHIAANRIAQPLRPITSEGEVKRKGYGAELAVANYLGLPWRPRLLTKAALRQRYKPADVGENVEVKAPYRGLYFSLGDKDSPERLVVVAEGDLPLYTLLGWAIAGDCQRPEYRKPADKRGPAFWRVPTAKLRYFPLPEGLVR